MKKLFFVPLLTALTIMNSALASHEDNIVLPVYVGIAMIETAKDTIASTGRAVKDAAIEAGKEIKEESQEIAAELTQEFNEQLARVKVLSNKTYDAIKNGALTVANSQIGQDAAELATQFAEFPAQISQDIKESAQHTKEYVKTAAQNIADSEFIARAQEAKQAVIASAQRAVATAQKITQASLKSEAAQDLEEVLTQFADFPKEAYDRISLAIADAKKKANEWRDSLKK